MTGMTDEQRVTERVGVTHDALFALIESGDDRSWRERAACTGIDPDLFFPERGDRTEPAKAVCATCPVVAPCLASALREHESFGVFGGTSERERKAIRRAIRAGRSKRRSGRREAAFR
jgi:WhiB family redox-sensing transcriptional regulator